MLNPSMASMIKEGQSYYSLVLGVAKRARSIVDDFKEANQILVKKPVKIAVDELSQGIYSLSDKENIGKTIER